MSDPLLKEKPLDRWPYKSPRHIMQHFATECCRHIHPEVWTVHWSYTARQVLDANKIVIVDDLRFSNEEKCIRHLANHEFGVGCIIIKVIRSGQEISDETHASEVSIAMVNADVSIINNKLEDFKSDVRSALSIRVAQ